MPEKSYIDLETEGVELLEALKLIYDGCQCMQRIRDTHLRSKGADVFTETMDVLLWGATPIKAFIDTKPKIVDSLIAIIESGEYLIRLKGMRDNLARVEKDNPQSSPESVRAAKIYEKRRWGSMN